MLRTRPAALSAMIAHFERDHENDIDDIDLVVDDGDEPGKRALRHPAGVSPPPERDGAGSPRPGTVRPVRTSLLPIVPPLHRFPSISLPVRTRRAAKGPSTGGGAVRDRPLSERHASHDRTRPRPQG